MSYGRLTKYQLSARVRALRAEHRHLAGQGRLAAAASRNQMRTNQAPCRSKLSTCRDAAVPCFGGGRALR